MISRKNRLWIILMHKVLLTGITGFLGSHIAENLLNGGMQVIGLKRVTSDTWRCKDFHDKITWINMEPGYQEEIASLMPDIIIHCAWIGVEAADRDNWITQVRNIDFLMALLEISKNVKLNKFIFLGSQAEYGYIDQKVAEDFVPSATSAYGAVKLACCEIIKTFSVMNDIEWIWLRLFSVFGEKENKNWLIPSVLEKMKHESQMDFTGGEQKYAYLYVKDFSQIIRKLIERKITPGIYNISSNDLRSLKSVIEEIRLLVNPDFNLNFGALPYRPNQPMHVEGDISKLTREIGEISFTNFNVALSLIVAHYLNQNKRL